MYDKIKFYLIAAFGGFCIARLLSSKFKISAKKLKHIKRKIKMQIYLKYDTKKGEMPEFLLLEMQGSIESEAEDLSGLVLGEIQKGLQDVTI